MQECTEVCGTWLCEVSARATSFLTTSSFLALQDMSFMYKGSILGMDREIVGMEEGRDGGLMRGRL